MNKSLDGWMYFCCFLIISEVQWRDRPHHCCTGCSCSRPRRCRWIHRLQKEERWERRMERLSASLTLSALLAFTTVTEIICLLFWFQPNVLHLVSKSYFYSISPDLTHTWCCRLKRVSHYCADELFPDCFKQFVSDLTAPDSSSELSDKLNPETWRTNTLNELPHMMKTVNTLTCVTLYSFTELKETERRLPATKVK